MSIKLLILDVDGTMTNGKITYSNSGEEFKSFCVKDGLAIASWIRLGRSVAIITGRESKIVERRAKELGIEFFYQKIKDKATKAEEIFEKLNISWENVASIGDDLNDYTMLKKSKQSFAPSNAVENIKHCVNSVLSTKGGEGAVREMIELIVKQEGLYKEYLGLWDAE